MYDPAIDFPKITDLGEITVDFCRTIDDRIPALKRHINACIVPLDVSDSCFRPRRADIARFKICVACWADEVWMTRKQLNAYAKGQGMTLGGPKPFLDLIMQRPAKDLDVVFPILALGQLYYQPGMGFGRALCSAGVGSVSRGVITMSLYPRAQVTPSWQILLLKEIKAGS